jgi:hypothetical protein
LFSKVKSLESNELLVVVVVGLALAIALVSRWVCAAMACAKCVGKSKHNLFKNAKGRLY